MPKQNPSAPSKTWWLLLIPMSLILIITATSLSNHWQPPIWLILAIVAWTIWLAWRQHRKMHVSLTEANQTDQSKRGFKRLLRWEAIKWLAMALIMLLLAAMGQATWLATKHGYPLATAVATPFWQIKLLPAPLPELVTIPAGEFLMGGENGNADEKPVHTVTIQQGFQLGKYEVTFREYDYFVSQMRQAGVNYLKQAYPFPSDHAWGRANRPVMNINWFQAQDYVNWLSKQQGQQCRLPSEAEWEYAARAGTTTAYPWGDDIGNNKANCIDCGSEWDAEQTAPVGQFPANPFGLYDMHGNVWEWVEDCWHEDYNQAPNDGRAWLLKCTDDRRVLRGGAWIGTPLHLRSAGRNGNVPDDDFNDVGFRVLCSPPSVF